MQSDELVALIPVYEEQAHAQGKKDPYTGKPKGWEMPFGPLLTRLLEKTSCRVIRADTGLPAPWPKGYSESSDYVDYAIEM
jgi:hypothetical protein